MSQNVANIVVMVCPDCKQKAIKAEAFAEGPMALCSHISTPVKLEDENGLIVIVLRESGEVLFVFDLPRTS